MKRKHLTTRPLSLSQVDPAVSFNDAACDYPKENFEQIAKRLVPRGFGKSRTRAVFEEEARKMFSLAQ